MENCSLDPVKLVNRYLQDKDWRVKENSNAPKSIGSLTKHLAGAVAKKYWLEEVYPKRIVDAYHKGYFHIHDLSVLSLYCCGYSLKDILKKGVRGVPNIPVSTPAHHLDSALSQICNMTSVFQNEIAGAVAFSSLDTLLAPFIHKDRLSYSQVYQYIQNFIYAINSNSRAGAEPAFSNVTLDQTVPKDLRDQPAIIAGVPADFTYGDCQEEMDLFNEVLLDVYLAGDAEGKPFSYPIPTYSITKDFDWDSKVTDKLFELAGKFGTPYFSNFINSDLSPEDCRSMCCRLRLNLRELRHRNGGLFGSGDSTGSIGVVTLNLPRLAYETKHSGGSRKEFYDLLDEYMDLAKESLVIKRTFLNEEILPLNLLPAYSEYVGTTENHFSTIGVIGMNEMCVNLLGVDIVDPKGREFSLEVSEHIRSRLQDYQEETPGVLWNYEATPAEATCVVGSTLIQTTEGNIAIQDLVGREDVKVLCYDTDTDTLRIKKAHDIRETGSNKRCVRVTFDNGQSEVLTPNHQVYTQVYRVEGKGPTRKTWYERKWIPAEFLEPDMSVVSNYQYSDGCNGFGSDRIRNSLNGKLLHRFIYEELVGEIPDGYVIHHKDFDKTNNSIDNLELMTFTEHKSLHAKTNNPRPEWFSEENPFYGRHHSEESIQRMCESKGVRRVTVSDILPYINLPYEEIAEKLGVSRDSVKRRMKESGLWECHVPNHKVVSVEYLDELYDVYNMEVEDCEDYFIGGSEGILVHNCFRLALIDRTQYPDIYTQGTPEAPYYTNSCHAPVNTKWSVKELFDHQDDLQVEFTGGTVVHLYCGGPISGAQSKYLIKTIFQNYKLPYASISPVITLCPTHGNVGANSDVCPICGEQTNHLQRITGYVRDTRYWNPGKKSEYSDRNQFQDFLL